MPRMKSETIGTGDQSWIGDPNMVYKSRSEILSVAAFTAGTHYPNGYLPSGTPVALVAGVLVPYDKTEATTTNAGVLAGHILTDQPVVGAANFGVPVIDSGRVKVSKVPYNPGTAGVFAKPIAPLKTADITIIFLP